MNPDLQRHADLFFALIADNPRFNRMQLWRYVELRAGATLTQRERGALLEYARSLGAVRENGLYEVYRFPRKRRTRPKDDETLETWGDRGAR